MIVYKNKNGNFIFIHIPKNGGKYFRKKILLDKQNKIISFFWGVKKNLDLCHLPYMKIQQVITNLPGTFRCFAFVRNPYDRCISAFFYLNPTKTIPEFQSFIKETLSSLDFSEAFHFKIIHYYPQYLFLCTRNNNNELPKNIEFTKLENFNKSPFAKTYNHHEYLDAKCFEIINDIYKRDFDLFCYEKKNGIMFL